MSIALEPAPADFLQALRARTKSLGITTADTFLREFQECIDGSCPSHFFPGMTERKWRGLMKRAERTVVYQGAGFSLGETFTVKEGTIPSGIELPKHTIALVNTIVTTPTQDRDGDILETLGAHIFARASHLFNHLPVENIGRFLKETAHTKELLSALLTLHSTQLAENVAVMYEHGSLETSHGFLPRKWEPLKNGEGFHVLEFDILEISGVSVPSNPDAGPIEFSRNKLTHPLLKQWGQWKFRNRKAIAAVDIDLASLPPGTTITLGGDKPPVAEKASCTCHLHNDPEMKATKDVLPFHDAPVSKSDTWDADSAVNGVRSWAGVDGDDPSAEAFTKYGEAFALRVGDKDNLTSYKLPYKQVEDGKLVINPKGVSAGIGALNGGRGGGMDISAEDRKGAYSVLVKAYKKAYPDQEPPELKSMSELDTKGINIDLRGSFERTSDTLRGKLKPYLLFKGVAGQADWVYLAATYSDRGVACILEDAMMPGDSCCAWDDSNASYYEIPWTTENGEPTWSGQPVKRSVDELLTGQSKSAYAIFTKGLMKPSHLKKLESASDRLQKAHDHEDAKAGPKLHIKRAKAHVDGVIAAHDADGDNDGDEKGFVTEAHHARLEKAAAMCQKALDHEHTTEAMAKHIKAAKGHIEGVMSAHEPEEDEEEKQLRLEKEGRAVSSANEKKLRGAQAHLKEIAEDKEGHPEVTKAASDGVESIDSIFAIGQGGDAGQDYDENGNYVGTDVGAYTDGDPNKSLKAALAVTGELSVELKAALSKSRMEMAKKAFGHAQSIVEHKEATEHHKGLAMAAKSKLKSVMGEGAGDDGPAMGTDPSTAEPGQAQPEKSIGERLNELADEARFLVAEADEAKLFDLIESAGAIASLVSSVKDAQLEVDISLAESAIDRQLEEAEAALA